MIECEFNILPRGWHNKEESFILWKPLERNSECMVIQTLNMLFDAKSYQRMPREVTGKMDGKGSIDNLFTKIISLEKSIMKRILFVGDFYKTEIECS